MPLSNTVHINSNPETLVIQAAVRRQWHEVRRLVANGADVNVLDTEGRSLLWLATAYSYDEGLIIQIIDKGADLNISSVLPSEKTSISVAQLSKKIGFTRVYNRIISESSSKIVIYIHLSSEYVSNHIGVTIYDHNLDYGIEIDPDDEKFPKSIRRSTLIRRLTKSYAAFSFSADIQSLAALFELNEELKKLNKFYNLFHGNCADLVMHLVPKYAIDDDITTCDFLTVCTPPIPSFFDCITNPNHVFKQIYSNVKDNLLFEHNARWYTPRFSVGDLLTYLPCCIPTTTKDFELELSAVESKLSENNHGEQHRFKNKVKLF